MPEDPRASQPSGTPGSSDAASKRKQHPQSYQVELSEAEQDNDLVWRVIRQLEAPTEEDNVINDAEGPASQEEAAAQATLYQHGPEKRCGPVETPDEVCARMQALFKAAFERAAKMTPEEIQEAHPDWPPPGPGVSPGAAMQLIDESMFPGEENNGNDDDDGVSNDTEKGPPRRLAQSPRAN